MNVLEGGTQELFKLDSLVVETKIGWITIWFLTGNFASVFFSNYMSSRRMIIQLGCCLQGHIFVFSGF